MAKSSSEVTWATVEPIFSQHCTDCHGQPGPTRGLDLGTRDGVLAGGRSGKAVDLQAPSKSELLRRLTGDSLPRMPLDGPPFLGKAEIAVVRSWIEGGCAPAPAKVAQVSPGEGAKAVDPQDDGASPRKEPPGVAGGPPGQAAKKAGQAAERPAGPITWAHVAPIFAKRCVSCHTHGGVRGRAPEGLELFSLDRIRRGGERLALVPGNPDASPIVRHVRGVAKPQMPFGGPPLTAAQVQLLERWIRDGARDASGVKSPMPVGRKVRYRGMLTGRWQVDGLDVLVDGGTRIDKSPRVGRKVEVRGVVQRDGTIRATRMRRR